MSDLKLGYAYEMAHSRKGKARVQVDAKENREHTELLKRD